MSSHSLRETREGITSRVRGIFCDFRTLTLFYLAFLGLCLGVYVLGLAFPWLQGLLVASRSTPWGIVTSLFVHSDLGHLVMNMAGLFSFFLVFSFTNYFLPYEEKARRISYFIVALLASTVFSNVIWIVLVDISTIGASGLVYASEGAVTGFCLTNFWNVYSNVRFAETRSKTGVMLVNLLVFLSICVWMVFYTNSFLSYGRDINVLIHGSSFVLAFILAIEWGNIINMLRIGVRPGT